MSWESLLMDKLKKYPHKDLCQRQVLPAITAYKDLRPTLQMFVHNDGKQKELFALDGTIPVNYRGNTYNIPICLFLQDTHPFAPPMVFVRPTNLMAIKVSKHVDNTGRVFLQYLSDWSYPRSDLTALIQILCCAFAEEPPVYAKQSGYTPPPQPGFQQQYGGFAASSPNTAPYPTAQHGMPSPMQMPVPDPGQRPAYQPPYPPTSSSNQYRQQMPYRPPGGYPPATQAAPGGYPHTTQAAPGGYPPASQAAPGGYPHTTQAAPGGYPPTTQAAPGGYPATTQATSGRYPPVSRATPVSQNSPTATQELLTNRQTSISEETIKASLLSAVEDKLRRRIKPTIEQAQYEIDGLSQTQQELKQGRDKLEEMIKRLEKEQSDVENNINVLTQKNEEISSVISKLESESEKLNIDESVVTTAPLYNQILNLFAEENAVEDTIYYLSESLRKEAIDADVFLKQIRTLSRKQFMLRALLYKARKTAGLGDMSAL